MKSSSLIKFLFLAVCIIELTARFFNWPEVNLFTKPLLMPLLLVYFTKSLTSPPNTSFLLAFWALVFSWIGDVVLMYQEHDSIYFLIGLSAFAIAQLLYISSFSRARYSNETAISWRARIGHSAPFVLFSIALLWKVFPAAGPQGLPVLVYALLLLSMVISAILRKGRINQTSFNQLLFGASLFMLSDSLIAWNKFVSPVAFSGLLIMATYVLAQWNIVNGLLRHYNRT
ncbi:MAG: lysoplasmalogenase [Bacteroidetes bacterium]|nr:lysoplasmalogenase [Bacteroidota bacterium]MDA1119691.1 lysoplasmalogenase [Bacteroidota bacterium]